MNESHFSETYFERHDGVLAVFAGPSTSAWRPYAEEFCGLIDAAQWTMSALIRVGIRQLETDRGGLGQGVIQMIRSHAQRTDAPLIVLDIDLTAGDHRKIEREIGVPVLDRTGLILAIFALRATTHEGKIQVRLAQMEYLMPRLTNMWSHFGRIRGGAKGMRGKGETQLESDRRALRAAVARTKTKLKKISQHRGMVQKRRERQSEKIVALVGYTNAGKSSLLEYYSGEEGLSKDALFATLDPRTRKVDFDGQPLLLTDTVGLIDRLATSIVEAFHATLETAVQADCIIIVLDVSDPAFRRHADVAFATLDSIGADETPTIIALNKIDQVADDITPTLLQTMREQWGVVVATSPIEDIGMGELAKETAKVLNQNREFVRIRIPGSDGGAIAQFHADGWHVEQQWDEEVCILTGFICTEDIHKFASYS